MTRREEKVVVEPFRPSVTGVLPAGALVIMVSTGFLVGCATGPALTAIAAAPGGTADEGGISFFYDGPEIGVDQGLPAGLRNPPSDLGPRPRGRFLPLKYGRYAVVVDASDPARPPRMWVDAVGSGDFSGVAPVVGEWDEGTTAYASAEVTIHLPKAGGGTRDYPVHLAFRGPIEGPGTLQLAATTWLRGKVVLGGREFPFALLDADVDGDYRDLSGLVVAFDRDGDGVIDGDRTFGEGYGGDERFNLGTGTYRISHVAEDGSEVVFEPAWPAATVRTFLGVGDPAPPIPGTDLEGRPISLQEFRGRKVLLLFWAEW